MRRSRGDNGRGRSRARDFGLVLRFQKEIRLMAPVTQLQALAWLRQKRGRPARVFWEILPTGERRRI